MSTDRGHTRGRRALALVAGLAVVAAPAGMAACGVDDQDEPSTSPTTSSETTTTPSTTAPLSPEEEAKAVYLEFVDVVERLISTEPDPDDPDLNRLATDPVLGELRDNLGTLRAENHRVTIGPRTSHQVLTTSSEGSSTVIIRECYVGNDTTTDLDDGSIVDQGLSTRVVEGTVVKASDAWVVSEVATLEILDGEVPCPA